MNLCYLVCIFTALHITSFNALNVGELSACKIFIISFSIELSVTDRVFCHEWRLVATCVHANLIGQFDVSYVHEAVMVQGCLKCARWQLQSQTPKKTTGHLQIPKTKQRGM